MIHEFLDASNQCCSFFFPLHSKCPVILLLFCTWALFPAFASELDSSVFQGTKDLGKSSGVWGVVGLLMPAVTFLVWATAGTSVGLSL